MRKFTDAELARKMCEIYVSYYNEKEKVENELIQKEINQKINLLSEQTHKTSRYLKALLNEYFEEFTKEEQRIIKCTKQEIQRSKSVSIIEKIKDLSEEELEEFVKKTKACKIAVKLNAIIKGNNSEKAAIASEMLEQIRDKSQQLKEQKRKNRHEEKYEMIKKIFDTMINNGYFSLSHFIREYHGKYGLSIESFDNKIREHMDYLRKNYREDYNNYQSLMERNTWISWEKYRYQIERIIEEPEKYDIVDYYMYIKLPSIPFLQLCRYMYDDMEYSKIRTFIKKYYDEPSYNPKYSPWVVTPSYTINGETITIETQELILKFMEENNIPTNFFLTCFTKYKNKEINIEKQKEKSLN